MGRNIEKQKEYQKRWRIENKQKINEYHKKWREENLEKAREYNRRWAQENKEKVKEYREKNKEHIKQRAKQYYEEHKDEVYESQKQYVARNREKVTKMILKKRKENAELFKKQGQMFCYLPKTERQNRMIATLCRKKNINEEDSRKILEERNWNIKEILNENTRI